MDGEVLRKDLITVPSCAEHNAGKSRDDEFLMVSLAGLIGNNSIGYRHRFSKVNKAIRRSSYKLLRDAFSGAVDVEVLEVSRNKFVEVIWGTPDVERLRRCFEHIAYGLHFHHFGCHPPGRVDVHLGFLAYYEERARTFNTLAKSLFDRDLSGKPHHGENPHVFSYQVTDSDMRGFYAMRLSFYGGLSVHVSFGPTAEKPVDLAWLLVSGGIKTTFLVEGKEITFNDDEPAQSI